MKITINIWKLPITIEHSRTPDEEKLRAHKQYAKDQRALLKQTPKPTGTNSYHNCNFGTPYPVLMPQPQTQQSTVDDKIYSKAVEYAAGQTNLTTELVEQVLDAVDRYIDDRAKK